MRIYDIGMVEETYYLKIKYGTDDAYAICLLKNGLSLSLTLLILEKYRDYLPINIELSTVQFADSIIGAMEENQENQILIYEVRNCI